MAVGPRLGYNRAFFGDTPNKYPPEVSGGFVALTGPT